MHEAMYELIADGIVDIGLNVGSDQDFHGVWDRCESTLRAALEREDVKNTRWWSSDLLSMRFFPQASMVLMILIVVGLARRWWREVDDCPLFWPG